MTASTPATAADRPIRILAVEDSPTQSEQLKHVLEQDRYEVVTARDGRAALEIARAARPDLVVSDIVMPEMDGYQLCKAIKSEPALAGVPVILLTALSDPEDIIRALECRAHSFVVKPYDGQLLLSRVRGVLAEVGRHQPAGPATGVQIEFNGHHYSIETHGAQILNLVLSTYEAAVQRNQELSKAKDDLRSAYASLEATNKELESFSYSVSHDLRSPLRVIDSFTRRLSEDYRSSLDDGAQHLIERVLSGCNRMSQLIDDLLMLSRLTRSDVHRGATDLSTLAESVVNDLRAGDPSRNVAVTVAPQLVADGDARLLRVALENLLGNAWKFTSKRPDATIEVGKVDGGARPTYFVRDNGAGFDPAYADKLFGVFQRLHSTSEFPGTGVGLATVQRVIQRHGGRIWAESSLGSGATFYFTL